MRNARSAALALRVWSLGLRWCGVSFLRDFLIGRWRQGRKDRNGPHGYDDGRRPVGEHSSARCAGAALLAASAVVRCTRGPLWSAAVARSGSGTRLALAGAPPWLTAQDPGSQANGPDPDVTRSPCRLLPCPALACNQAWPIANHLGWPPPPGRCTHARTGARRPDRGPRDAVVHAPRGLCP